MSHVSGIIINFALILAIAGLAAIVCKRLRQPLVLGYVVAGFFVNLIVTQWIPQFNNSEEVSLWAEFGIIFLMFGLGLEFSFIKLSKVGKSALVTGLIEMTLMIFVGIACGLALGWNVVDAVFLGGMLSISSTTIIVKAFNDLSLKGKRFTQLVFGVLIVEDIIGIFLLVFLSTTAASSSVEGAELATQIGRMALYLIAWFVASVVLVPTLLKKVSGFINDEVLLIVSIALCLGMVVLASFIGFSTALGAFVAGSVLAGTLQANRIDSLIKPIKDLFGAIFFVSVGMLISPLILVEYWFQIIVITIVTLIFKPLFAGIGALISGENLKVTVKGGLSLSQIGEFSFIIASLGVSLGVTSDFLYPLIVSVSVATTLTTPYYIKASDNVYSVLERMLPSSLIEKIETRSKKTASFKKPGGWSSYFKSQAASTFLVGLAAITTASVGIQIIAYVESIVDPFALRISITLVSVVLVGLFISNLQISKRDKEFASLWNKSKKVHISLLVLSFFSFLLSFIAMGGVISSLSQLSSGWTALTAFVVTLLFSSFSLASPLNKFFLKAKAHFLSNLDQQAQEQSCSGSECGMRKLWEENS